MADVQISWFDPATGSREARAVIADAVPAGLWRRGAQVFVAARLAASGEWHVWQSRDDGRTLAQITSMTIWNPSDFRNAHVAGIELGGAASVATVQGSDPLEIKAKVSTDAINWPADVDASAVGTYSGDKKIFQIFLRPDRRSWIISNGMDAAFESTDGGVSWTAI